MYKVHKKTQALTQIINLFSFLLSTKQNFKQNKRLNKDDGKQIQF